VRKVAFEKGAFKDFSDWATADKKIHRRIVTLILDVLRQPFAGLGKPEPLKGELRGYWSRRIDKEHRLVYRVDDEMVTIISCRYHYR